MNLKNLTPEAKWKMWEQLSEDLAVYETQDLEEEVKIEPIKKSIKEAIERIDNPDKLYGLDTGYRNLNRLLRGLAKGELIVVGGRTGQGKTMFVQSILMNLALQAIPTLFFTLEMPPPEVTARFIGMYRSVGDGAEELTGELPIYYYSSDKANLKVLGMSVEKAIKEHGVQLVAIDHLHFFSRSSENEASEIGVITRGIKLLARKYNIPIILISHIKKVYSETKDLELDDLRGSSFIAQDADTVIMIQLTEEKDKVMICTKKNRRAGLTNGDFPLTIDSNYYLREE